MNAFNKNMNDLNINLKLFDEKIKLLQNFLTKINDTLNAINDLANIIADLDTILNVIHIILSFISVIPQIRNDVILIDKIVIEFEKIVSKERQLIKNFLNDYLEPIQTKVNFLQQKITAVTNGINSIADNILKIKNGIDQTDNEKINNFVIKFNPILENTNNSLIKIIELMTKIETEISIIENRYMFVIDLRTKWEKVLDEVRTIHRILLPISGALDHHVTIPYVIIVKDVKSFIAYVWRFLPIWRLLGKQKIEYLTYTVNEILSGIENIAEHAVIELKKEAEIFLESILDKINLKIEIPKFPGLERLENEINELKEISNNLEPLDKYFNDLLMNINSLSPWLDK